MKWLVKAYRFLEHLDNEADEREWQEFMKGWMA